MKRLFYFVVLVFAAIATDPSFSQSAKASLQKFGSSASDATGSAEFTIVNTTKLRTDTVYFGTLDGLSIGAHFLCCASDPAAANRATADLRSISYRSYVGFSQGPEYDMNDPLFWDDAFLRASGSVAGAQAALTTALASGAAHFLVTSDAYPNGEIRGSFATAAAKIAMRIEPGRPIRMSTTGTINNFECSRQSERCVFPVYVSSSGPIVDGKPTGECQARVDFNEISVFPHIDPNKKIRIIWQLVEGNVGDTADYRFMNDGIVISGNVPSMDFNAKGRETADGKRYKWHRVGRRPGQDFPLDYIAYVERYDSATGTFKMCQPIDPKVVNKN